MATYWENSCSFGLRYVSWYKYLIVSLVLSHLGFWSGNLFLIAPFPDLCLLVPSTHRHIDCNLVPFSIGFDSITSEILVNALSDRYTHLSSVHNKKRHSCIGNETETYENRN